MKVSPWFPNEQSLMVAPGQIVYTMMGKFDELDNEILCDYAWTKKEEMREHFWFKVNCEIQEIEMPYIDYIYRHFREIYATNPFWEVDRLKFATKYAQDWKQLIVTARQKSDSKT